MNLILKSTINKKRKEFDTLCNGKTIPGALQDNVTEFRDVPYIQDGDRAHMLDIYSPICHAEQVSVIVNIHGGGLIMGNKEFNRHFCLSLCNHGFLVFSIEYRLCPETTVFGQLQDIAAAMNYIDKMIPKFKGKPGIVHMVGDSAGAFLALYTAAIQRNPMLARTAGVRPSYLEIQSMALISGMFYTTRKDSIGLFLPKALYGEGYKKHPFYPFLDPSVPAVGLSLPPCMLITSKADHLRNYTYDLAAAIRHNRAPCILRDYGRDPNLYHAFSVFDPELPESWKVIEDIASFFNDYE